MSHEAAGAPLGPRSLLWRIAADWRSALPGLSAGMLQLMWPDLGQGVQEHSAFFDEPWDRIHRSVPQIWGTIFADDDDPGGLAIRDLHKDIGGTRPDGNRYHALAPETFWWAHATFTWEMFETADRFDHRMLRGGRRERLYQETVTWYRRYGVSDRVVPADRRAFKARFDHILRHDLELTPTASRAVDMALHDRVEIPGRPAAFSMVISPILASLAIGCLPSVVRRRFDIPWSLADEARLAAIALTVRNAGVVMPPSLASDAYLRSIERLGERAVARAARRTADA